MRTQRMGLLLLIMVSQCTLFVADSSARQDTPNAWVDIPRSEAPSDGVAAAPVTLTVTRGVEVASFSVTIRFPSASLSFQEIEVGGLGKAVGAEVKAEPTVEGDETTVQFSVAAAEKDGRRVALPQGPLATLRFRIAKEATPAILIPLTVVAASASSADAGATVNLDTRTGGIFVTHPAATACFFYMH